MKVNTTNHPVGLTCFNELPIGSIFKVSNGDAVYVKCSNTMVKDLKDMGRPIWAFIAPETKNLVVCNEATFNF